MTKAKKAIAIFLSTVLGIILILYVAIGAFGTFDLGADACSGGYTTELYHSQKEAIKTVVFEEIDEYEFEQIHYNLSYNDKTITTHFTNENDETVRLSGNLKWYWNKNVIWNIAD